MHTDTIELLAPAGNAVCLHAAVRAGADAVYLGLSDLNARRGADNFTLETLQEACDYAHLRAKSVYLTVNTAVLPGEVTAALETVRQAYRRGVDAFIIQDIGLAREVARTLPQAVIHASTQMNTHSAAGVEACVSLGARRITLARELSLSEVAHLSDVARSLDAEVEVFAHGALCVCYSGQCFASSLIGGRSANRGMCAQPCRLPYELHNKAQRTPLSSPGDHLLSPKDLCTIALIPRLMDAGVASLKIEGRMKSPDYVYAVVGVYRAMIDRVKEWRDADADAGCVPQPTDDEMRKLSEAFSRGFTTAYLESDSGNDIMSYGRPNNRGVFAGRVASVHDNVVRIAPELPLAVGDIVEFWTNKGHFAHEIPSDAEIRNGAISFSVEKRVSKGDRVFRVRDASAAYVDDVYEPTMAVNMHVTLQQGAPLAIEATCGSRSVSVEGPVVEAARTKAVTSEDVRTHIDRFGNTPFVLDNLTIVLGEQVGIGFSQLHKLRARALDELQRELLAPYADRTLPRVSPIPDAKHVHAGKALVYAWATNPACARAAKRAGADVLFVPALNYKRGQANIAGQVSQTVEQAGYPNRALIALPVVDHDPIDGTPEQRLGFDPWSYVKAGKTVFADSAASVVRAKAMGATVESGPHIPVTNELALQTMAQWGVDRVWLSPELSLGQIQQLGEKTPVDMGIIVSGAGELMVTEHCLLQSQGPCNGQCPTCARRKSPHYLKDRKGFEMPTITDCCGRSHLYNAVALDIVHAIPDLQLCGVSAFMVDTTLLNVEETSTAVARAVRARDIACSSDNAVAKMQGATTGHLFRGVS